MSTSRELLEMRFKRFLHYGSEQPIYKAGERVSNKYYDLEKIPSLIKLINGQIHQSVIEIITKYSIGSNEEREVLECASMFRSPGKPKSLRKVGLETGIPKRVEFCSCIIEFHELDPSWHTQIVFSDESTFYRNGASLLKSQGITVWAAVSCNGVLFYDISDSTVIGNRYEQVLNEQVMPHFIIPEMNQAIFRQDVAPPHFTNPVKQLITK
ncbi:hypothetical protein J6590_062204 [Homalodisca vitripennis]|nr:hypothetical protein J6590_062204 [Homalodisca vitripennis]